MLSNEELLERAAATGTFESQIVRSQFPTPSLPPAPPQPQPRRLPSPQPTHVQPSSQDSTTSDKENAPTRSDAAKPPVPSFEGALSPLPPRSSALARPGEYPQELTLLHESIKSTLKSGFSKYPPHTVQRLAELILFPKRHYRYLPPYLNALDRVINVSSNTTVFPLPHTALPSGGVLNGVSAINDQTPSAGPALGSDESLGGALLTPIPWLSPAGRVSSNSDRELQSESTEMVDGPNGAGRIETVSVVNGVMTTSSGPPVGSRTSIASSSAALTTQTQTASTEQTLRAEGAVTQGELLRQEQQAGVVANPPRSLRMSEEELGNVDTDQTGEEKPHARGPDEIGMEDTGPQERPPGAELDMEAAVGRSKIETSVERELSPQDSALSDAGKDEVMKDADSTPSEDVKVDVEEKTSDGDTIIDDVDGKIEAEVKEETAKEEK
ncbi:hypothetical protein EG328_009956 [Venturia inaequalis]|uniref:Protein phosphatase 4 core regulatory subunit R2 n=1 Tax=Venturia inaequalis TaxID=5025 RepID=A0A8H3YLN7_VENIN|nr:hypothetical protein EG328_009956 [Venturia inaequalis]